MRCKQGDLAVIVMDDDPKKDIGKLVRVKEADGDNSNGDVVWVCDSLSGPLRFYYASGGRARYAKRGIHIPDAWLRPIRDPGDDAVDQFVRIKETTLDATDPLLRWVVAV